MPTPPASSLKRCRDSRDATSISWEGGPTMILARFVIKTMRSVSLPLAMTAAFASTGLAQVSQGHGTIAGTVRDPVGDAAPKIVVQAKSSDGKTVIRATSESTGKYTLS